MPANEPPSISDEVTALRAALAEAVSLLAAVDSDANNVQLDIARWQRRHHAVVNVAPQHGTAAGDRGSGRGADPTVDLAPPPIPWLRQTDDTTWTITDRD